MHEFDPQSLSLFHTHMRIHIHTQPICTKHSASSPSPHSPPSKHYPPPVLQTHNPHTRARKKHRSTRRLRERKKSSQGSGRGLSVLSPVWIAALFMPAARWERETEKERERMNEREGGCRGGVLSLFLSMPLSPVFSLSLSMSLSLTHTRTQTHATPPPNTHIQAELGDEFEVMHAYGHIVKGMQQLLEKKFDLHPNTTATIAFVGTSACVCDTIHVYL